MELITAYNKKLRIRNKKIEAKKIVVLNYMQTNIRLTCNQYLGKNIYTTLQIPEQHFDKEE